MKGRADALRQCVHMVIADVVDTRAGITIYLHPSGMNTTRKLLIRGAGLVVDDVTPRARSSWTDGDESQRQVDIGDEMHEQQRLTPEEEP